MIFTIPAALIMLGLVVYPMLYGFFISTQKSNFSIDFTAKIYTFIIKWYD
jgi:ABC-type sugar transport system permease subunit